MQYYACRKINKSIIWKSRCIILRNILILIRVEYERIERYEYELKYNMKECLSDY